MLSFDGVFTALVTPFRDDRIDEKALRGLVERQIDAGVAGLVPCGTTGESVSLSSDEHTRVVQVVVEQARSRVPVIAGAGTASTHHTIALSRAAREAGVDGLLLVCPYYSRPTQQGLEAHFRAVLKEVPLPTMLYNIPARTGVDLAVDTLERLGNVREIVAIKEASGNVIRSQEIVARCGERFAVLSGDDALCLGILAVGGSGVVSVTSNVAPAQVVTVVQAWQRHDARAALIAHQRLMPLHAALFVESNPAPTKLALAHLGLLLPEVRLPIVWPEAQSAEVIRAAMLAAGIES